MSYEVAPTPKWKRWREARLQIRVDTTVMPNTDAQPGLFDARPADPDALTIAYRFAAWRAANPAVLDTILAMARAQRAAGRTRISAKALVEDLRRAPVAVTSAGDPYKIDNRYTPHIADAIVALDPTLDPCIERRARRAQ